MGEASNRTFLWSGGNTFKVNKGATTDMKTAAEQREQIRREQREWEANRANGKKVPELIAQLLKALNK